MCVCWTGIEVTATGLKIKPVCRTRCLHENKWRRAPVVCIICVVDDCLLCYYYEKNKTHLIQQKILFHIPTVVIVL